MGVKINFRHRLLRIIFFPSFFKLADLFSNLKNFLFIDFYYFYILLDCVAIGIQHIRISFHFCAFQSTLPHSGRDSFCKNKTRRTICLNQANWIYMPQMKFLFCPQHNRTLIPHFWRYHISPKFHLKAYWKKLAKYFF